MPEDNRDDRYTDAFARMKAREGANRLLQANTPQHLAKEVALGAAGGAFVPAVSGAWGAAQGVLPFWQQQKVRYTLEALRDQGAHLDEGTIERLLGGAHPEMLAQLLGHAQTHGINPEVPTHELLAFLGKRAPGVVGAALPFAAIGAGLGAMAHRSKVKERKKLLDEASKTAGEQMSFSPGAMAAFWAELGHIESHQKLASTLPNEARAGFDARGRLVAHSYFSELEKISAAMAMGEQQTGELAGGVQNEPSPMPGQDPGEVIQNESMPAHGVIASRVTQLDPKRALGVPVMQPPPGYVYNPELAQFVPQEGDPGWMAQQQALEAARNKGWYDQGQKDTITQQAQQNLDNQVQADLQNQQAQQQQSQMMQQSQQMADHEAMMTAAREGAKAQVNPKPQPGGDGSAGGGDKPSSSSDKKPEKKDSGKGGGSKVTVHVGGK